MPLRKYDNVSFGCLWFDVIPQSHDVREIDITSSAAAAAVVVCTAACLHCSRRQSTVKVSESKRSSKLKLATLSSEHLLD